MVLLHGHSKELGGQLPDLDELRELAKQYPDPSLDLNAAERGLEVPRYKVNTQYSTGRKFGYVVLGEVGLEDYRSGPAFARDIPFTD